MTVRAARMIDIPRLSELMAELHAASIYADRTALDDKAFRRLCVQAIGAHTGRRGHGSLFVCEAAKDGAVEGFIIGAVQPLYLVCDGLMASDLLFYAGPRADKKDAGRLLDAFVGWARSVPGVLEIQAGVTSAVIDHRRARKLYERKGFEVYGQMYRMEVTDP